MPSFFQTHISHITISGFYIEMHNSRKKKIHECISTEAVEQLPWKQACRGILYALDSAYVCLCQGKKTQEEGEGSSSNYRQGKECSNLPQLPL